MPSRHGRALVARAQGRGSPPSLAASGSRRFHRHGSAGNRPAGNYTPESAAAAVEAGTVNAVAFGRFISKPDLPERIRAGAALNPCHRPTFYGGDAAGYTDYPRYDPKAAAG